MQCQTFIGQHNYMADLKYVYRGTTRDVLRAQPPFDDIPEGLVVKVECLAGNMPSRNEKEYHIIKAAFGQGFPGLYGQVMKQWHGEDICCLLVEAVKDTVADTILNAVTSGPPDIEKVSYLGEVLTGLLKQLMCDTVDRLYAHTDAHADHWGVRQTLEDFFTDTEATHRVEVVCLDASQIASPFQFEARQVAGAVHQLLMSVSALLRRGRDAEMWGTCADWLDSKVGQYCDESTLQADTAKDAMQEFMDDVTDHWFNLVAKGQAQCSRRFAEEPEWALLWARVERARNRLAAQSQAPFRGIGRYAMSRPDRVPFSLQPKGAALKHKPEMPTWASDDVNNLIDFMYESLKPHFDQQRCHQRRTDNKKQFRNNCNIIKRMLRRFSDLLWKPQLDSVRPQESWLEADAIATVVEEEVLIMMQPHDGTDGIPEKAQIHRFFLSDAEVAVVVADVVRVWRLATTAKEVSEDEAWESHRTH